MVRLTALVFFAVELGAGFGAASATVVSTTDESVVVEFHVEVETPADSVVLHLALAGEDPIRVPMVERDDESYGVTTEVKAANYQVVFEAVGDPGAQSSPVSLIELGAELAGGSEDPDDPAEEDERSPGTQRWLWLGVALGAASLSALAFWVLGDRDEPDDLETTDQEVGESDTEGEPPSS
ncbi:MAG TPA: hypothetical protein VK990_10095 [Acidimicrobiia bacterium]|nr:hypothetical protein [Acidimicrobiia bacterium]